MSITWHELREGVEYRMTHGDSLDGKFYSAGDRVEIVSKIPMQPFHCRNLETGVMFYASGASSFTTDEFI